MRQINKIMTLEIDENGYTLDIEDEKAFAGKSLAELKILMEAIAYAFNNVLPNDPWAGPKMMGNGDMMAHIYTHNIAYTFHYLRNIYEDMEVFTNTINYPINADIRVHNIIFRLHDTNRLVNKTIEEWAEDENLTGNIVLNGIKKYREKYNSLDMIPPTQAGELRRECKHKITDKSYYAKVDETIKSVSFDMYKNLVQAFIGGTLGVNDLYKDRLIKNIYSDDMGSAYPGVMVSRKFPMSPWEDSSYDKDDDYRYLIIAKFTKVSSKTINRFYPYAKCDDGVNQIDMNNSLDSADEVTLTLTDIDFEIFKKTYKYESCEIISCKRSKAEYLPKQLVNLMLKYYNEKTLLKDTDEVSKYRHAKVSNNCFYGVAVTKNITDTITFKNNEWGKDLIKTEEDYNKKRDALIGKKTLMPYQVGVWVTAYVREIMWNIIPEIDMDVVYYDTDCIKHRNNTDIFKKENARIMEHIKAAASFHKIPLKKFSPNNRTIGCFEEEDFCYEFKAIGMKKYAKRTEKGIEAFISGMPKANIHLNSVNDLRQGMTWKAEESGKKEIKLVNDKGTFRVETHNIPFSIRDYNDFEALNIICGGTLHCDKTIAFRSL